MEFFGLEGIWSGGGREGADNIVGFSKMLEFAVTVGESWSWECWMGLSFNRFSVDREQGWFGF